MFFLSLQMSNVEVAGASTRPNLLVAAATVVGMSSGLPASAAAAAGAAGAASDGVTPMSLQDLILELSPPSLEPPPSSASFAGQINWCQVLTTAAAVIFVLAWVFLRLIHIMAVIYG